MAVKRCEQGTTLSNVPKVIVWAYGRSVQLLFFLLNICLVLQAYYLLKSSKQPYKVVFVQFLQRKKKRLRKTPGHTGRKCQG